MHSFLKSARHHRLCLFATMLFGLAAHARAGSLTISGQPPASVVAGQLYSFTPTVSGSYSKYVRYSIANKPAWASFSPDTGKLSGVPSESNVGTYSNIAITASTWRRRASLAAFSVSVNTTQVAQTSTSSPAPAPAPTPPPNAAPVISGVPATGGSVGHLYSFTPSASDADGDALTFSIQNKPSWATFSTATGALSGTPDVAAQYSSIVISVSDGKSTASLAAFNLTISPPVLGSATVTWTAPATNVDGTPLTDLAGFRVLYGTSPTQLDQKLELPNATFTSVQIEDLTPGTYYFEVKAYTAAAMESDASPVVWKTIM